jgi:hypothetical protein
MVESDEIMRRHIDEFAKARAYFMSKGEHDYTLSHNFPCSIEEYKKEKQNKPVRIKILEAIFIRSCEDRQEFLLDIHAGVCDEFCLEDLYEIEFLEKREIKRMSKFDCQYKKIKGYCHANYYKYKLISEAILYRLDHEIRKRGGTEFYK